MLTFFDYVFYRITDSKYYQFVDPKDTWVWGWGLLSTCECLNVCSVIMFIFSMFSKTIPSPKILVLIIFLPIFITNLFRYNEERYMMLKGKHIGDSNRKIKGICVVSYIIGSIILFAMACIAQAYIFKNLNGYQ